MSEQTTPDEPMCACGCGATIAECKCPNCDHLPKA